MFKVMFDYNILTSLYFLPLRIVDKSRLLLMFTSGGQR